MAFVALNIILNNSVYILIVTTVSTGRKVHYYYFLILFIFTFIFTFIFMLYFDISLYFSNIPDLATGIVLGVSSRLRRRCQFWQPGHQPRPGYPSSVTRGSVASAAGKALVAVAASLAGTAAGFAISLVKLRLTQYCLLWQCSKSLTALAVCAF